LLSLNDFPPNQNAAVVQEFDIFLSINLTDVESICLDANGCLNMCGFHCPRVGKKTLRVVYEIVLRKQSQINVVDIWHANMGRIFAIL